ncbi:MAG: GNAT family N-acetyltransferase [Chloroflexota bacterium]
MQTNHVVSGLRLRPYQGESDLADLVRVENLEAEADALPERSNVEDMAAQFAHPNDSFDPARDVTLAEMDGQVVAVAFRNVVDTTDGVREYRLNGAVDPAFRRRGIGRALLLENERRLRDVAAGEHGASRRVYGSWNGDSQPASAALLQSAGYGRVRYFFDMVRPNLDDIEDVTLPDGLEIRSIGPELTRAVWDADIEAFRDHWGGFDHSDEQLQRWLSSPSNDLSLWLVAFDGGEVAGGVINSIDAHQNEAMGFQRGWLSSVFTRRAWRRRGLAKALIARSLALHRDRGMTSAALGVDAENPSGALGLYEGMGFAVNYRATAWRKAFEA